MPANTVMSSDLSKLKPQGFSRFRERARQGMKGAEPTQLKSPRVRSGEAHRYCAYKRTTKHLFRAYGWDKSNTQTCMHTCIINRAFSFNQPKPQDSVKVSNPTGSVEVIYESNIHLLISSKHCSIIPSVDRHAMKTAVSIYHP